MAYSRIFLRDLPSWAAPGALWVGAARYPPRCHPERSAFQRSRKPALSEDRASDRSRTGTCFCFSRSSTTKEWVPHPSFARVGSHEPQPQRCHPERPSSAKADDGSRRTCICFSRPATHYYATLSESFFSGVEGPASAFHDLHAPQKNGCPILAGQLFFRLGWESTDLNFAVILSEHRPPGRTMRVEGPASALRISAAESLP